MFSGQDAEAAPVETKPITILWGSQTGNSEGLARQTSKALGAKGFAPTVYDMGEYDTAKLKDEERLLIITSTYGDGEPPDNAVALHGFLGNGEAPKLDGVLYSVLALGDTNYPDFCKCGIEFDERLAALGATRLTPRVDCDVDYEEPFSGWLAAVEEAAGASSSSSDEEEAPSSEPEYGKKNPFPAKILVNRNLNAEGSAKETRHVEISLAGSGLSYEPGDAVAIVPENDAAYVADLLKAAGLEADAASVEELRLRFDVTNLTLKNLKAYAALTGSEELAKLADDREAFKAYAEGRQFIDLLLEHPYAFADVEELTGLLSPLAPRLYSISSSPKAHPDEVHVTVGVVRYDAHGRARKGVCSNFLAEHDGESPARIYFHPTKSFRLPENPDVPVIMVGPGTGIAPFRAFLEERAATGASGKNWLFFGDQHEASDFLYEEELRGFLESGVLTKLDTAFSRDQERKVYVQDRMVERGKELYDWLEEGGSFYVCGDASRMAKDVDAALHRIVAEEGGMSADQAVSYVDGLKKQKRYLRDVY